MGRRGARRGARDRQQLLAAERSRLRLSPHGRVRAAIAAPAGYHVGQSSLAFQWVLELTSRVADVGVERCFADAPLAGTTLESESPLAELDVIAWSCSYELDAVEILRTLDAAGIPRQRRFRDHRWPLLVVGGPLAGLNPLPLAPAIDVFCLGAAELVWPPLLELLGEHRDRERLLDELASRDGYFVPSRHLGRDGRPEQRLRRLEKPNPEELRRADMVPAGHLVTPYTEYADRVLVEISRGCPEHCRYCWATYNTGSLRPYPGALLAARVDEAARLSERIGFVATAAGDHPDLPQILQHCLRLGLRPSLSSLRIPALTPAILGPLAESGARSITIAPETGSDRARHRLGKSVSNDQVLHGIDTACRCGLESVKMYFMAGLPGEDDDDLLALCELVERARDILVDGSRDRGRVGLVTAAVNPLVPKPYTPFHRQPMLDRREWRRRMALVEGRLAGADNVAFQRASWREAAWQGYLARADSSAFPMLEAAASGASLGRLLADHRAEIEGLALTRRDGEAWWHFVAAAPQRA